MPYVPSFHYYRRDNQEHHHEYCEDTYIPSDIDVSQLPEETQMTMGFMILLFPIVLVTITSLCYCEKKIYTLFFVFLTIFFEFLFIKCAAIMETLK